MAAPISTTDERWMTIRGFEEFEVSNHGRVRERSTKQILRQVNDNGKMRVALKNKYTAKQGFLGVSILVAEHFIGERPQAMKIGYKNGDSTDNRLWNLEYVPYQRGYKLQRKNGESVPQEQPIEEKDEPEIAPRYVALGIGEFALFSELSLARIYARAIKGDIYKLEEYREDGRVYWLQGEQVK